MNSSVSWDMWLLCLSSSETTLNSASVGTSPVSKSQRRPSGRGS